MVARAISVAPRAGAVRVPDDRLHRIFVADFLGYLLTHFTGPVLIFLDRFFFLAQVSHLQSPDVLSGGAEARTSARRARRHQSLEPWRARHATTIIPSRSPTSA